MSLTTSNNSQGRSMARQLTALAAGVGARMLGTALMGASQRAGSAAVDTLIQSTTQKPTGRSNPPIYASRAPRRQRGKIRAAQRRRRSGPISRVAAPLSIGRGMIQNIISAPTVCSFGGMNGIKFRGSQIYCDIKTGDGTTRSNTFCLNTNALSFFGFHWRPGLLDFPANGNTFNVIAPAMQDPLVTQCAVHRFVRTTRLAYQYVPNCPTSTAGSLTMAWEPAGLLGGTTLTVQPYPTDSLLQFSAALTTPIWEEAVLDVTPYLTKDTFKYINAVNPAAGSYNSAISGSGAYQLDYPFVGNGTLMAATDTGANATTYGRLMVLYEVELYYRAPYIEVDVSAMNGPSLVEDDEKKSYVSVTSGKSSPKRR